MKYRSKPRSFHLAMLASLVVLCLGLTQAQAGTITFDQIITASDSSTFPPTPPPPFLPPPAISLVLPFDVSLPQFDPSIGTLTGVTFNATTLSQSATLNLINNSDAPISVFIGDDSGVATFDIPGFLFDIFVTESRPNSNVLVGANSTESLDITPFPIELTDAAPNDLTPFIGTGDFSASVTAVRSVESGPFSLFPDLVTASGSATAQFSVTYEYIPEPSSLALLGLGGLLVVWRRCSR